MNVSSDVILEVFKAVAVDYNYRVSVSDLRNYISSHNWKFKLTKKTDSGKLYDLEFKFVKGLTEDLFWDLSHIYPDDFGKFYSGDYPEYDLGDEYETEYDNWCYFLDDLQNEMRKVKYSSKELEEFEIVSDSKQLKHKNMKRVSDKADIETIRYWVQSAIYGAEQDGIDITVDVVKDYVGYDEQDPETQAWLDVIIEDEIENLDEPQAKDYWREAEDKYLMGRRSDSRCVKDGLTRSERHNRSMEKIFASAERFNQNQMKWLREQGISEDEIQNAKRNTGLHGSKLSELVIQTARANGDTRENSEILGEAMGISDSRRVKDGVGIISEDLEDAINAELSKLGKGIQVWHYKSSDDRVIIATDNRMFSKKKDGINNVMSDFGYTYNKSYPMLGSLGVKAYIAVYDKKVSDSRRVKDNMPIDKLSSGEIGLKEYYKETLIGRDFHSVFRNGLVNAWSVKDRNEQSNGIKVITLENGVGEKMIVYTDKEDVITDLGYFPRKSNVSDSRTRKGSIGSRIADAKAKYFSKDLKNLQAYRRVTDSEGKIKEDVVFLIEDSDVLAVFPNTYGTANRDQDTMVCYSHNGQHGVCTYDYANTLKTADSKQYNELKDELANYVGYNLTIVDSLPSEAELKQNGKEIRDSYIRFRRGLQAIDDARMLARGEEIEYKGKRGKVQYALFHGQQPVVIRWQNEDGSEEFEVPYNQVASLKVSDSEDDVNIEQADLDIDDAEVTDGCGKKKGKNKTADGVKRVKITKRQNKKTE